ncbi:rna-directed dna polymerase from mobile element jockey-like [Pitangus sulphuratus]|nr:rna-directed dna polymerase from mobile element jockey-like [Pitangus sulphuratus]
MFKVILNPLLLSHGRKGLMSDVVIEGHFGHNDHEAIEFKMSADRRKSTSKTSILDMRRADFRLLREIGENGHLTNRDTDKAKINAFFVSVFNTNNKLRGSHFTELEDHSSENDKPPVDSDLVLQVDPHKSMGADGIHVRIFKELAGVIVRPLSMIFELSWESGEISVDWKLANIVPVFKKGKKDDPGNYRPVSLTPVTGKLRR